jgi:meiotically up-regulated gene 157 (Mug157) protein
MHLRAEEIFPGVKALLPAARYQRVDRALTALFTRTTQYTSDGLPFIITGDIPAMWLRDSTWQVKPLLNSSHPDIIEYLVNVSKAQVKYFLIDPYANAFNPEANGNCWHKDFVDQSPWVFERKFELDSWASILYLARKVFETYAVTEHLDANFERALEMMLDLAKQEQRHDTETYIFERKNAPENDYLSHGGRGAPLGYTGMVFSAFRPSDDACKYGYLVPANIFFASELRQLPSPVSSPTAQLIADEIEDGIRTYALRDGVFAYEVDGLGNCEFMDDANTPSLLSLPFLGTMSGTDQNSQATRAFVLSEANPYFYSGKWASGIGSAHTPVGHVWPIALAMQALTSDDKDLQLQTLQILEDTDAGTGNMHESFHVDDPKKFTREWFSWSDMTYVDLLLTAYHVK